MHFIERCRDCDKALRQCRCPAPNKTVRRERLCADCEDRAKGQAVGTAPEPRKIVVGPDAASSAADFKWSTQRLSPGRQVHYHTQSLETFEVEGPFPATIVAGDPETGMAELEVLFPASFYAKHGTADRMRMMGIPFSVEPRAGCWSWPVKS